MAINRRQTHSQIVTAELDRKARRKNKWNEKKKFMQKFLFQLQRNSVSPSAVFITAPNGERIERRI